MLSKNQNLPNFQVCYSDMSPATTKTRIELRPVAILQLEQAHVVAIVQSINDIL